VIITVTPNPSIDRTATLTTPLLRGAVHRAQSVTIEPGGKGVNVARALTLAGLDTLALLPSATDDPIVAALESRHVRYHLIPVAHAVRTNLAITESDGTTTKINEPGGSICTATVEALTASVVERATDAAWVVLCGSIPPGMPDTWYSEVVRRLLPLDCKVAVDTSDAPLAALAAGFDRAAPDLIKPNSEELAHLAGVSADDLEAALAAGDPTPVIEAARTLIARGARRVLATLGAAGAVLVDDIHAWVAEPAPISPLSTVGAGDSALAGYIRAEVEGADAPQRLQMAVAYGSAAAALPGSALPAPDQIDLDRVTVSHVPPTAE